MNTKSRNVTHLVCFSHLSWKFVYQRPQHILSRFTNKYTVYYIEEFFYGPEEDGCTFHVTKENVTVVVPHLKNDLHGVQHDNSRKETVIKALFKAHFIDSYILWYYTPMAFAYTAQFKQVATVYDCMDELSAFRFAPAELKTLEQALFDKADIVFTGGNNLYEAKKTQHANIYPFPSSIDKAHFKTARDNNLEPDDQEDIPHPRLGFFGVIDERFDVELIAQAAYAKPEWHFVLLGPVTKIDPATLPKNKNIHYLGPKTYDQLPLYLSGWDLALIPFALNESTRYISPTKTPEYLAGGKPVISTAIIDVVNPYHTLGLVHIIQNAKQLVEAAAAELSTHDRRDWLQRVDAYLNGLSWDATWEKMDELLQNHVEMKQDLQRIKIQKHV